MSEAWTDALAAGPLRPIAQPTKVGIQARTRQPDLPIGGDLWPEAGCRIRTLAAAGHLRRPLVGQTNQIDFRKTDCRGFPVDRKDLFAADQDVVGSELAVD